MSRPSTEIQAEITELTLLQREATRTILRLSKEVEEKRVLAEASRLRINKLFLDKAEAERNELWLSLPKIVWAQREKWGSEGDYRAIAVSAKQIRVGRVGSGGCVSLYQKNGLPVGRPTGNVIDIEKTFPEGFPK